MEPQGQNLNWLPDPPKTAPKADLSFLPDQQAPDLSFLPDKPPWLIRTMEAIVPTALRVGGAVVGSVLGTPFGPAGVMAGGAAGSMVGEGAGQAVEIARGRRRSLNPTQIAVQGAIGAIPVVGRAGAVLPTILKRGAQGAVIGGVSNVATELAEGRRPTAQGALEGAAMGTVFGGGFGALEARALNRRVTAPPTPVVRPSAPPPMNPLADALAHLNTLKMTTVVGAEANAALQTKIAEAEAAVMAARNIIPSRSTASRIASGHLDRQGEVPVQANTGSPEGIPPGRSVSQVRAEMATRPPLAPGEVSAESMAATRKANGLSPVPSTDTTPTPLVRPSTRAIEETAAALGAPIPAQRAIRPDKVVEEAMVRRLPERQRADYLTMLEEIDGAQAARRGVQPIPRTQALAEYLTIPDKLNPGTILNAEESTALANRVTAVNDEISTLAEKVANKTASALDTLKLEQLRQRQVVLAATRLGVRAEIGRALNMERKIAQSLRSMDDKQIEALLDNPYIRQLPNFAEDWGKLTTDVQRMDYIKLHQKLSAGEKLQAYFYANILSGPKTHLRNFFGTAANAAFSKASLVPAVGYDIVRSKMTGAPRTVYASELAPQVKGALLGMKTGLSDAWFTLRHGYSPSAVSAFDVPRPELGGGGKNPLNWPGRVLEATDQLWLNMVYHSELYGRLYARARSTGTARGLSGHALDTHVTNQLAEWRLNGEPAAVKAEAQQASLRQTFRETGGKNVQAIMAFKQNLSPPARMAMNFVLPFVKVPANVMRQAIENLAPIATVQGRAAVNAGGRSQAEAIGRMTTAMSALSLLAWWATQGKISGSGPKDPEKRAALMEEGWRPNSVKIGNQWVNYEIPFQAISTPLFAVANLYEKMLDGDVKAADIPGKAVEVLLGTAGSTLDQSFLSGISDLNNALNDPSRYAASYGGRLAQGLVPFSGAMRNTAQAIDPVMREPKTVGTAIRSIVPGLSTTVAPKLSRFGEPMTRTRVSAVSPITANPVTTDPVLQELHRLNVMSIGNTPAKLDKTKTLPAIVLSTEERQALGRSVKASLEQLFGRTGWKNLDDDAARALIEQTVSQARATAILKIRRDHRAGGQR